MKTFNFEITFICANTDQERTLLKEYTANNYLNAKIGLRQYCKDNKTIAKLLDIVKA